MSELLLTYIVPVYNTERYLSRCLSSIISQGLGDDEYEVLVVDDGSTDGSVATVEAFASTHAQVHIIRQQNQGVSAARNCALDKARGHYIQFVDSDDYLEAGVMAPLLYRALDERIDVVLFNYKSVDIKGTPIPSSKRNDQYPSTDVMSGVDYLSGHSMTPYIWRFLISRSFFEKGCAYLGDEKGWRFDTSLIVCEDGSLIARFLLAAERVAHDGTAAYCYVNRSDSAMHSSDIDHIRRRLFSQVDAAAAINDTIRRHELQYGQSAPESVAGLRNVYLFFAMTKALTSGCVDEVLQRIRQAGLFPFPCVGPEANYYGKKWKVIHTLMMRPRLWAFLSKVYRLIKK